MLYVATVVFSLVFSLYLLFRSELVQKLAVRLAADYLSEELHTEIRIKGFNLSWSNGLVIEEIRILDKQREVLFSARELGVRPGMIRFSKRKININRIFIENGVVQLLTHKGDSALNLKFIIDYFASTDTTPAVTDTTPGKPWDITFSAVTLRNTRFHFQDQNEPLVPVGMDYANIDVSGINLELTDIDFDADTIHANIRHLAARERSGFRVDDLSGEFQVSPSFLKAQNLKIVTPHSDLALSFQFLYENWNGFNDFLNDMNIKTRIEPCYLDLQDIGYFAPELLTMKDRIRLSGEIEGTVNNFKARNLRFAFGQNSFFYGNVSAVGLPDVTHTYVNMNIKMLQTTKADIESIRIPGDPGTITLPEILEKAGSVHLTGLFSGFYNDFVARSLIHTDLGGIRSDLTLRKPKGKNPTTYSGQVDISGFEIGRLSNAYPLLGTLTARGDINGSGFSLQDAEVALNLHIDSIGLNSYIYRNLDVTGSLSQRKFNGKLKITDPCLRLDFDGLVDMADSIPVFDFDATIHHALLYQLNLLKRDSLENLSARIKADVKGKSLDDLDGTVHIENAVYAEGEKSFELKRFSLLSKQDTAAGKSYHLQSDFVDADITGKFSFTQIVPSLMTLVNNYLASFNLNDSLVIPNDTQSDQTMNFNIQIKEADDVTAIFLPILKISPNTELEGSYDEKKSRIFIRGWSPSVFISGIELSNWYFEAENRKDNLLIATSSEAIYLKRAQKNDSLELKIDTFNLTSAIQHDTIRYHLDWKDRARLSDLSGFVSFSRSPVIDVKLDRFNVYLNDKFWTIHPENYLSIDTTSLLFHKFEFSAEEQYARFNGQLSAKQGDTLFTAFNKVNISTIDRLLGLSGIDLDGILSGNVKITEPYSNISVHADLHVDKFTFNKELLGDAIFRVGYNSLSDRFDLFSQIIYTGNVGTNIPFSLKGSLYLEKPVPRVDFDIGLKNLNMRMLGPFVSSFMSGVNGLASGQVRIRGKLDKPDIEGQLRMMRTEFKINYLNIPYSFADVIEIDSSAFHFRDIVLFDSLGHKALLNGKITHHYFSDIRLGLNIEMTDFAAFNNTRAQNGVFYGKARGTGNVAITGPIDNISVSVKASNGGDSHVVIPIDLTASVGQVDYITFIKPQADTLDKPFMKTRTEPSGLSLDLGLRVNQDAVVEVFLPNQLGKLTGSGTGNLLMGMTPATPFTLSGTYSITKGSFLFQFKNYLRLPMQIREGSIISWTGDPADANLSVSAVYKLKAPLKGLTTLPEEEGIRIPVECIIRLGGKLTNPNISFAINLPNVEESIRTLVYTSIDTNNETVMNEQTLSLMILNQFKPVVSSSTTGTVDVGAASMSLITNQVNSWISGLSQNVNVNMNYKPATSTTQQEFDVGISTQLFNDRLLIDGTFGMNSYNNQSYKQSSTIVGDINIEYILTTNRRWRVRAFNRTNTLNILNNNAPYTQGVGFKYQRDFATFKDLFTPVKKKKH